MDKWQRRRGWSGWADLNLDKRRSKMTESANHFSRRWASRLATARWGVTRELLYCSRHRASRAVKREGRPHAVLAQAKKKNPPPHETGSFFNLSRLARHTPETGIAIRTYNRSQCLIRAETKRAYFDLINKYGSGSS